MNEGRIFISISGLTERTLSNETRFDPYLALTEEEIQWRAVKNASYYIILGFNITNLDSFTHGLLGTFAFDLPLLQVLK